jgi:hypothetical protein
MVMERDAPVQTPRRSVGGTADHSGPLEIMNPNAAGAIVLAVTLALSGCFYPPLSTRSGTSRNQARLTVPYDLAWDAVNSVIRQNNYKVRAQDPNHGIIEAQGTTFTTEEADCGEFRSLGGTFVVDPTASSSAVYNFRLKPDGPEASIVVIEATFVAPLSGPFRRPTDIECASRGTDEARLLKEVAAQAASARRPTYKLAPPSRALGGPAPGPKVNETPK